MAMHVCVAAKKIHMVSKTTISKEEAIKITIGTLREIWLVILLAWHLLPVLLLLLPQNIVRTLKRKYNNHSVRIIYSSASDHMTLNKSNLSSYRKVWLSSQSASWWQQWDVFWKRGEITLLFGMIMIKFQTILLHCTSCLFQNWAGVYFQAESFMSSTNMCSIYRTHERVFIHHKRWFHGVSNFCNSFIAFSSFLDVSWLLLLTGIPNKCSISDLDTLVWNG